MSLYYCSASTGNDSTGNGTLATPWLSVKKALQTITPSGSGDTIYMAPGTDRTVISVTITPTAASPITVIGDVANSRGFSGVNPGECIVTAYTTNDTTAPSASSTVDLNGKSYINFQNITFYSGGSFTGGAVKATTSHSHDITFTDCAFVQGANANTIDYTEAAQAISNWTIDRCKFLSVLTNLHHINITEASPSGAADVDLTFLVQNCIFIAGSHGVHVAGPGSLTSTGKPGGVRLRNCTFVGAAQALVVAGANASTTTPCEIHNSISIAASTALQATTTGQIIEDYNRLWAVTARNTVTAGTHSISGSTHAVMAEIGQADIVGRAQRPFFTPTPSSPLLGFGSGGTSPSPPTVDAQNRPRPAGGASTNYACGYMERHDTAVSGGAANADGATGDCHKITGPGDQDYDIPVDATSTTISIKQKTASYVGTNYPQIELLANAEIGVTGQTVTDSAANTSYTTLTLSAITPTAVGVVTLRVKNRTGDGAGILYIDTIGIT